MIVLEKPSNFNQNLDTYLNEDLQFTQKAEIAFNLLSLRDQNRIRSILISISNKKIIPPDKEFHPTNMEGVFIVRISATIRMIIKYSQNTVLVLDIINISRISNSIS
jgi:hypothetical protein